MKSNAGQLGLCSVVIKQGTCDPINRCLQSKQNKCDVCLWALPIGRNCSKVLTIAQVLFNVYIKNMLIFNGKIIVLFVISMSSSIIFLSLIKICTEIFQVRSNITVYVRVFYNYVGKNNVKLVTSEAVKIMQHVLYAMQEIL